MFHQSFQFTAAPPRLASTRVAYFRAGEAAPFLLDRVMRTFVDVLLEWWFVEYDGPGARVVWSV